MRLVLLAALFLIPHKVYAACETILASDSTKVYRTGDTMTGSLTNSSGFVGPLTGNVVGNLTGNVTGNCSGTAASITGNIASYQLDGSTYTTAIGLKVAKAGDTMTGTLNLTGATTHVIAQSSITTSGGFFGRTVNVSDAATVGGNLFMTGIVQASDGNASGNGYDFKDNLNGMGMHRVGADILGFATASNERMRLNATGGLTMASGNAITLSGAAGYINSGSSITTSGGFFGDGSGLTNVGGGISLTSTQTFSGAITFTSSVTVGAPVYTTTATFQRAVIGSWFVVASTEATGSNAVTFTNLTATATYRMHWELVNVGANGRLTCWFWGQNASGGYNRVAMGYNTSGTLRNNSGASVNAIEFDSSGLADEPFSGHVEFWRLLPETVSAGSRGRIFYNYQESLSESATGLIASYWGGGQFSPAAGFPDNGTLRCVSAGSTWTGKFWIEAMLLGGGLP